MFFSREDSREDWGKGAKNKKTKNNVFLPREEWRARCSTEMRRSASCRDVVLAWGAGSGTPIYIYIYI